MMTALIRKMYDYTLSLAAHRHAKLYLAGVSFAESSFFPIPPDIMMIPMIIADRARAYSIALIATASSVLGGIAGYIIGYAFFEFIALPVIDFYGYRDGFEAFKELYIKYGVWIILAKGMTPIPYKVVTIASGAVAMPIIPFILSSIVARAMRFYLIAWLLKKYGAPIQGFIENNLMILCFLFFLLLIGGFIALKFLV